MAGDEERACSCGCEVRTSLSSNEILGSKAAILPCAASVVRPQGAGQLDSRLQLTQKRELLKKPIYDGVMRARLTSWLVIVFEGQVVRTHPQAHRLESPGLSKRDASSPSHLLRLMVPPPHLLPNSCGTTV